VKYVLPPPLLSGNIDYECLKILKYLDLRRMKWTEYYIVENTEGYADQLELLG
jgi:hypothetical protein